MKHILFLPQDPCVANCISGANAREEAHTNCEPWSAVAAREHEIYRHRGWTFAEIELEINWECFSEPIECLTMKLINRLDWL
jgi:hypothetical protein